MSYPFPFILDGCLVISPESSQAGKQCFYQIERQGDFIKAQKSHVINQRMVDAVFFKSNETRDEVNAYFYTGSGNSDGLLVCGVLGVSSNGEININNAHIVGDLRPGGFLPGSIQPFQKYNMEYGKGLCFLDISKGFIESNPPHELESENLNSFKLLQNSHHVHQDSKYICFDLRCELAHNFKSEVVFGRFNNKTHQK